MRTVAQVSNVTQRLARWCDVGDGKAASGPTRMFPMFAVTAASGRSYRRPQKAHLYARAPRTGVHARDAGNGRSERAKRSHAGGMTSMALQRSHAGGMTSMALHAQPDCPRSQANQILHWKGLERPSIRERSAKQTRTYVVESEKAGQPAATRTGLTSRKRS
jgi:hypothetical protein